MPVALPLAVPSFTGSWSVYGKHLPPTSCSGAHAGPVTALLPTRGGNIWSRLVRVATAAALLVSIVTAALLCWPVQAVASCATEGLRSPWKFDGVVGAVRSEQRVATVLTDDGRSVEVRGGSARAMSSVDRTFQPGGRYEFHPLNASSPFEDNSCTATRLLSLGPVPPVAATSSSSRFYPALGVGAAGLAALALGFVGRRSRWRASS